MRSLPTEQIAREIADDLSLRDLLALSVAALFVTAKEQTRATYGLGLLPLLAYLVGFFVSSDEAPKDFYTTCASVIATLLLTLAVQAAWFRYRSHPEYDERILAYLDEDSVRGLLSEAYDLDGKARTKFLRDHVKELAGAVTRAGMRWIYQLAYGLALLMALLVGQVYALLALMAEAPQTAGNPRPVFAAITAGLVGVAIVAIFGTHEEKRSETDRRIERIEEMLRNEKS